MGLDDGSCARIGMRKASKRWKKDQGEHSSCQDISRGHPSRKASWSPPLQEWVRINTDAGFCPISGRASTGVVVCGNDGGVLLSVWRFLHHYGSTEEAKAESLHGRNQTGSAMDQTTNLC
jgi:hypothetical protein